MREFNYDLEEIAEWIANSRFLGVEPNDPSKGGPPSVDGYKYHFGSPRSGWSETMCIITRDTTGNKLFIITSPHPSRR